MVRPKLERQTHWDIYLEVAKQLGLDRPGEERQARAGAHSALACACCARRLLKEVHKREGLDGRENKTARLAKQHKRAALQLCTVHVM